MYPGSTPGTVSAETSQAGTAGPRITPHDARQILAGELAKVIHEIHAVAELIKARQLDDYETTFLIPPTTGGAPAAPLSYEGKRHLLVWTPAALTNVSLFVPGIGTQTTISLAAGWTVLDPPRGAQISITTGPVTVKIRCTDHVPPGLY